MNVTYKVYTNYDSYTEEWVAAIHGPDDHHIANVRSDSVRDVLHEAAKVIDQHMTAAVSA